MPASFMRRADLFRDAGFDDVDGLVEGLAAEIDRLGLAAQGDAGNLRALRSAVGERAGRLPPEQAVLAPLVPEWLTSRNGDLASVLWLVRAQHGNRLDLPGFLLAVLLAFFDAGRVEDALIFARFVLGLRFDWDRVYTDPSLSYAFMQEREPNPLVWKVLDELRDRGPLRVLELGCGIGNDALGFLRSPGVASYTGVDLAPAALAHFGQRLGGQDFAVRPTLLAGDVLDVLGGPAVGDLRPNVVYSYSSLHYFASTELQRIFGVVKGLLCRSLPEPGFFAFAIKGAGSLWEGQGLPLYRPDVWVNRDGQSRWFPSKPALARLLDRFGYEVRVHELHDHWGYSEEGRRDVFHYVICSPRTEYVAGGI